MLSFAAAVLSSFPYFIIMLHQLADHMGYLYKEVMVFHDFVLLTEFMQQEHSVVLLSVKSLVLYFPPAPAGIHNLPVILFGDFDIRGIRKLLFLSCFFCFSVSLYFTRFTLFPLWSISFTYPMQPVILSCFQERSVFPWPTSALYSSSRIGSAPGLYLMIYFQPCPSHFLKNGAHA